MRIAPERHPPSEPRSFRPAALLALRTHVLTLLALIVAPARAAGRSHVAVRDARRVGARRSWRRSAGGRAEGLGRLARGREPCHTHEARSPRRCRATARRGERAASRASPCAPSVRAPPRSDDGGLAHSAPTGHTDPTRDPLHPQRLTRHSAAATYLALRVPRRAARALRLAAQAVGGVGQPPALH